MTILLKKSLLVALFLGYSASAIGDVIVQRDDFDLRFKGSSIRVYLPGFEDPFNVSYKGGGSEFKKSLKSFEDGSTLEFKFKQKEGISTSQFI